MVTKTFGERVKIVRGNTTQSEFGRLVGTSKKNISKYENNKSFPPFSMLEKFVGKLNVNLNWLICGTGNIYIVSGTDKDKQLEKLSKENNELISILVKTATNLKRTSSLTNKFLTLNKSKN